MRLKHYAQDIGMMKAVTAAMVVREKEEMKTTPINAMVKEVNARRVKKSRSNKRSDGSLD